MATDSTLKRSLREVLAMLVSAPETALRSTTSVLDSLSFPLAVVDRRGKILIVNKCLDPTCLANRIAGRHPARTQG